MSDTATLEFKGTKIELPVTVGTENEHALDISKLRGETKAITIDNGFVNTGSCFSEITFLDGEKGILRYRGYPIEQLAEDSSFIEVSYLLFKGELPSKAQLDNFKALIKKHSSLPKGIENLISSFPADAHPMSVLSSAVVALSAYNPELGKSILDSDEKEEALGQLMGQVKAVMAYFYRHSTGKNQIASNSNLNYCSDFVNMVFGSKEEVDPEVARALDILLILHADHEQNCSASTVRVVGSAQANVYASMAGGINALWGPLHGGANQAVLEMLEEIQNAGGDYKQFLEKAKDKEDPFKLMGFGHRVYKNFDPRAKIIKKACDIVLEKLNVTDPLLDIAKGLEKEALSDEYFVKRNLYPNVDFYSGIIYKALGIPTNMFTAMFVLGRLPGWMSQWKEMTENKSTKIVRPRQIYTGKNSRDYTEISKR